MKKEMLINVLQSEECRIAIVEDGVLEELYVERTSHENYTGNIYKGRIVNIEPAIQAAFVDFSVGRNGFLHVSDVEGQYYRRGTADEHEPPARRPRDESGHSHPRGKRDEARPPHEPVADLFEPLDELPPQLEQRPPEPDDTWERERPWGPDFDRPDLSQKGQRDRSERRFGEGLVESWDEPPPRTRRSPAASEPMPLAPEPQPPSNIASNVEPFRPARPTSPAFHPDAEQPPPTFGREIPPISPIEAELPPSRTDRSRRSRPPRETGRRPDRVGRQQDLPREEAAPPVDWTEPQPVTRHPAAGGVGKESHPSHPGTAADQGEETLPQVEPDLAFGADLEELEDHPRRRGRDAIRARGGERKPTRPRSRSRRPITPESPAGEFPAPEAPRPEPPQWGRQRARNRAGEPGYVPRRARSGDADPSTPPESPLEWLESEDLGTRPAGEPDREPGSLPADPYGQEGRKRRRRRRRRPGDRGPEGAEAPPRGSRDPLDELLDAETENLRRPRRAYDSTAPDIDETDDLDVAMHDEDELGIDEASGHLDRERLPIDDDIEPELEDEIRHEIEEILALETEMGLRGTVEARPRRGDDAAAVSRGERPRGRIPFKPPIQEIFKRGDEVLVQVIKESIGTKGPTLSTYISIPGRYLVLMPGLNRFGVSRKIADEAQRRRLRDIMHSLNPPKGLGFIVRTAGVDRTKRELARDLAYLLRLWKVILRRIKKAKAPAPIYQESDMIIRTIRDIFTGEIDVIWIDERGAYERAHEFMKVVMPKYADRVKFYDDRVPLFHRYGLEEEIAKIQRRRVDLFGGGSIVIDQTEALVAIDVNSGNFRVEDDAEKTAYEMNLRAAKEIARQLRLRDLGGVIVNDFIDMREERHRRGVERALRDAVRRDRARTKILRMSQFGIIEMTRQRIRPSLKRSVYEDCTHCSGAGVTKTVESMAIDVMRLLALAAHRNDVRRINVGVAGPVATYLNNRKRREIAQIENESDLIVHIRHQESAPAEHLQVDCFDASNSEVRLIPAPPQSTRRGR